ncbi:MAG: hypothetical protein RSB95_04620 [Bacilli bacterium]
MKKDFKNKDELMKTIINYYIVSNISFMNGNRNEKEVEFITRFSNSFYQLTAKEKSLIYNEYLSLYKSNWWNKSFSKENFVELKYITISKFLSLFELNKRNEKIKSVII